MKKTILAIIGLALIASCDSTKKVADTEPTVPVKAETPVKPAPAVTPVKPVPKVKSMLVGKEDRSALEEAPFGTWYNANYTKYTVKDEQIKDITRGLKGVTVTTFMGTWCGDSKRETPRMFKILDQANFKGKNLELITVDRTKKNPKEFTDGKNIIRVPTFIFEKDGKEIGRIVERPVESLEADMLKILRGEPYKHSYEK